MIRIFPLIVVVALHVSSFAFASGGAEQQTETGYGLDCSWPIHNMESSCGDLLGDRKAIHDEYIRGCGEKWGAKGIARCAEGEKDRLAMSRRQPRSMVVSDTWLKTAQTIRVC